MTVEYWNHGAWAQAKREQSTPAATRRGEESGVDLRVGSADRVGPALPASRPEVSALSPGPARRTILVVDDHALIRRLFVRYLCELGYEVLEAEGPLQAQRLAEAHGRIDLLLADFHMPAMNGIQLAHWFHSRFPVCKVLITSTAPWEVEPYIMESPGVVLMAKKDAFGHLGGILHDLVDAPAPVSAPAGSDRLGWNGPSSGPAGISVTRATPAQSGV